MPLRKAKTKSNRSKKKKKKTRRQAKEKKSAKKMPSVFGFFCPSTSLPSPPSSSSLGQLRQQLLTDFYGCLTVIKAIKRFDSHLIDARVCATETESEAEMRLTAFS